MSKTISRTVCESCGKENYLTWEFKSKLFNRCLTPTCQLNEQAVVAKQLQNESSNAYKHIANNQQELLVGEFKETRGLTEETCRTWGIMCQEDRHIFQYGEAQKVRFPANDVRKKKIFNWINYSKDKVGFFGEHLNYDYEKEIVITEGEFDAASCYQVGYQAYSIPSGTEHGYEFFKENLHKITKFKEIILWIDPDEAGQKLLKKVLEIEDFPVEKTKIVTPEVVKDANEALQDDPVGDYLTQIIQDAKQFIPSGLISGDMIDFDELEQPDPPGLPFPFEKMQDTFHGLHEGEVLLIGAGSGLGKSYLAKFMAVNWMLREPKLRQSIICLEERQRFTLQSLMSLKLKIPSHILREKPYKGFGNDSREFLGKSNIYFEKHFGSLDSRKLFQKLRFLANKSDVVFLDHVSIVTSGLESAEGERRDIDRLMTMIKTLATNIGCRFVIISHLRKPSGEIAYEHGLQVSPNSFRGSYSLYQLSDSVIALEGNVQCEFESNKRTIRALKNRYLGVAGVLDVYYYNKDTGYPETLGEMFK